MKNQVTTDTVLVFVGGCTGSNVASSTRYLSGGEGEVVARPMSRSAFGSNTTSLAILTGRTGILIDNGTGVAKASEWLLRHQVEQVFILQTHYHLDHVAGVPNNRLFFERGGKLIKGMYGPTLGTYEYAAVIDRIYGEPFWPITLSKMVPGLPVFSFELGDTLPILGGVRTLSLNHAGGCAGYRIPTLAGDICILTDNELSNDKIRQSVADFVQGSRLAYVDVQYRSDEYAGRAIIGAGDTHAIRKGWGHSTPEMLKSTYELMLSAPRETIIGHHDPKRSDEDLFAFEKQIAAQVSHLGTKASFAREEATLTLPLLEVAAEIA